MSSNYESSDEDDANDIECEESQFNDTEYLKLLKEHKKKRRMKVVSYFVHVHSIAHTCT